MNFLFLGFVFSAAGTRSAPAPRGRVENSFLRDLRVHFKEVVWSSEEGRSVLARRRLSLLFLCMEYELCKQFIFHIPPVASSAKADRRLFVPFSTAITALVSSHHSLSPSTLFFYQKHTHHCPCPKGKTGLFPKYFILETSCDSLTLRPEARSHGNRSAFTNISTQAGFIHLFISNHTSEKVGP